MGFLSGMFRPDIDGMVFRRDVNGLINALNHKDREITNAAARALGEINDSTAVEPLIKKFEETWDDCISSNQV